MLLERIEQELLSDEMGIVNHFTLIPEVQDCWKSSSTNIIMFTENCLNYGIKVKRHQYFLFRILKKNKCL